MDRTRPATVVRSLIVLAASLGAALAAMASSARAAYDLYDVDIGAHYPGASGVVLIDVNASGQVIGQLLDAAGVQRAVLWELDPATGAPAVVPIAYDPGGFTQVIAINDAGQVIGVSGNHAFVWTRAEGPIDLPPIPLAPTDPDSDERRPMGINAAGDIVGWSHNFFHDRRQAVLWRRVDAAYTPIVVHPDADWSEARGISDDGRVFGAFAIDPGGFAAVGGGFVWDANTPGASIVEIDNPIAGSVWLDPVAMNAGGQVVGTIADPAGGFIAFSWLDGDTTLVADPGQAVAVTDAGHVLGHFDGAGRFVWLGDPASGPLAVVGLGGALPDVPIVGFASDDQGHAYVSGGAWTDDDLLHAYRWSSSDGLTHDLFAATCGVLSVGTAVASDGNVVGFYQPLDGSPGAAFVTSPTGLLGFAPAGAASVTPFAFGPDGRIYGVWASLSAPSEPRAFVAVPNPAGAAGLPLPAEQAPVAACQDATVAMNADGEILFDAAILDGGSTSACALSFAVPGAELAALHLGANLVTLFVSDPVGRSDTCTATVTVIDPIDPIITCPGPVSVTTPSGQPTMAVDLGGATATDNAGPTGLGVTNDAPAGAVFAVGDHVVTWTATDGSGNDASCTQDVHVGDGGGNLFCKPATVTLDAAHVGALAAVAVYGGASPGSTFSGLSVTPATFGCGDLGVVPVTLSATRSDGQPASCSATVTVVDIAPSAVCRAAALTVSTGSSALDPSWVDGGSIAGCGTVTVSPGTFSSDDVGLVPAEVLVTNGDGLTATCDTSVSVLAGGRTWDVIEIDAAGVFSGPGHVYPIAMNAAGRVAGVFVPDGGDVFYGANARAFVWEIEPSGVPSMNAVTPLGSDGARPVAINASGQVVGTASFAATPEETRAFIWTNGSTVSLLPLAGDLATAATAVNAGGVVVGLSTSWTEVHAVRWAPPSYTPTLVRGGPRSEALGINDLGQIYGITRSPTTGAITATWFLAAGAGAAVTLPNPTGRVLQPAAMSSSGQIVGVASSADPRAFSWKPGDLAPTLLGVASSAADVNAAGLVSGFINGSGGFIWAGDASAPTLLGAIATSPNYLSGSAHLAGDVAFGTASAGGSLTRAFVRSSGGALVDPLAALCTITRSGAVSANTSRELAGTYTSSDSVTRTRAFVSSGADIYQLLPPAAIEAAPQAIVEAGWVLGTARSAGTPGVSSHGPYRGFVARPITDGPLLGHAAIPIASPAPVAVCASPFVFLDASGQGTLSAPSLSSGSIGCIASYAASQTAFDASHLGANAVMLTVTDHQGRQSSCTATVTVRDLVGPSITCPPDVTALTSPGGTTATVDLGTPTASDNVAVASFTTNAPTTFSLGTTQVRWQAFDTSGNGSPQCIQRVHVVDGGTILCQPAYVTLEGAAVTLDPMSVYAGATGGATFSGFAVDPPTLGCDDAQPGARLVTLSAIRSDGAVATCQAPVVVYDWSYARCRDTAVQLDAAGVATLTVDMVDGGTGGCGTATLSNDTFDATQLGPNSVTLTYTSAGGNTTTCDADVLVVDALSVTCRPVTVGLTDGHATVSPSSVVTTSNPYVATTLSQTTFGCADIGTRQVNVSVVDAFGSEAECTAEVEVEIAAHQIVGTDLGPGVELVAYDASAGRLLYNRDGHAFVWQDGLVVEVGEGLAFVEATGINASGQVVGTTTIDDVARAFRWTAGTLEILDAQGDPPSFGTAINDAGQIVGYVFGDDDVRRAFLWQGGVRTFLDPDVRGSSAPIGINGAGQVFGHLDVAIEDGGLEARLFYWGPVEPPGAPQGSPTFVDLGLAGSMVSMNAGGQVVITSDLDTLVWRPGDAAPAPLDASRPSAVFAGAHNDAGQVVGYHPDDGTAFMWQAGAKTPLAGLDSGTLVAPLAVNEGGDIVGVELSDTSARVLLWVGGGAPVDLGPFAFAFGELGFPRIADDGVVYGIDEAARAWAWRNGQRSDLTPNDGSAGNVSVVIGVADGGVAYGVWGEGEPTRAFITRMSSGAPTLVAPVELTAGNAPGTCGAVVSIAAEASDSCGPATITRSGPAEGAPFPVGTTQVVLTATGASGLVTTHTVSVTVTDDEAPVIALNGAATSVFDCATPTWSDPGATVTDNCDVGLVAQAMGTVDVLAIGAHTIAYSAVDAANNVATPVTRVVTIADGDGDLTGDCQDGCPTDADKIGPGACGCGVSEAVCADGCPHDPNKSAPGICGCGVPDHDLNGNGVPDCLDVCAAPPVVTAAPDAPTIVADRCRRSSGRGGSCGGGNQNHGGTETVVAVVPSFVGQVQAVDDCGGTATVTQSPPAGTELAPGTSTLTLVVSGAGGTTTITRTLTVVTGIGLDYKSPLATGETRAFKIGQVVPVKVEVETPCGQAVTAATIAGLVATLEVVELDQNDPSYLRHIAETQPNGAPITTLAWNGNHFQANLDTPSSVYTTARATRYFRVRVTVRSAVGALLLGHIDAYLEPRRR